MIVLAAEIETKIRCPVCDASMELGEHERSTYRPVAEGVYPTGPGSRFRPRSQQRPQMEKTTWQVPVYLCNCGFAVAQVDYQNLTAEDWYPACHFGHTKGWSLIRQVGRRRDLQCLQSLPDRLCDMPKSVYPPGQRQGFLNPETESRLRGSSKLPILEALSRFDELGATWDELRRLVPKEYSDSVIRGVLGRGMKGKLPYVVRSEQREPMIKGWESYRWFLSDRGQALIHLWGSTSDG